MNGSITGRTDGIKRDGSDESDRKEIKMEMR
jgi:hypothetical protein